MEEAEYFTKRCMEEYGEDLVSVVLFGSRPRGLAAPGSDLDFMIVLERDAGEERMRKLRIDFLMEFGKKIDTVWLTREDALENFEGISPLFATLLLGKEILYDKGGFFEGEFKRLVERIKKTKIRYYEGNKLWDLRRIGSEISP